MAAKWLASKYDNVSERNHSNSSISGTAGQISNLCCCILCSAKRRIVHQSFNKNISVTMRTICWLLVVMVLQSKPLSLHGSQALRIWAGSLIYWTFKKSLGRIKCTRFNQQDCSQNVLTKLQTLIPKQFRVDSFLTVCEITTTNTKSAKCFPLVRWRCCTVPLFQSVMRKDLVIYNPWFIFLWLCVMTSH